MGYTLRKVTWEPTRLEEEEYYNRTTPSKTSLTTKPQFPELLRSQVVAFNPDLPPAAFPSVMLDGSNGLDFHSNQALIDEMMCDDAEPLQHSHSSLLANENSRQTCRDSPESQDDSTDDGQSKTDGHIVLAEPQTWRMLELSVQYQIFVNLCQYQSPRSAADRLGLSYQDFLGIRLAIAKRLQIPGHVDLLWDATSKLDDGCFGYVNPDKLLGPFNILLDASSYDVAFPLSICKGVHFLDQKELDRSLIGVWVIADDGFAHSASSSRQIARRISVGVLQAFRGTRDDTDDRRMKCDSANHTVENTSNPFSVPLRKEPSPFGFGTEEGLATSHSSPSPRKPKRPGLMSQADCSAVDFLFVQRRADAMSPNGSPRETELPAANVSIASSAETGRRQHLVLRYNSGSVRTN